MENWEFKRVKFTEDSYKIDLDNLMGHEYRYKCDLDNNKSLILRVFINHRYDIYKRFFFNLHIINDYSSTTELQPLHMTSFIEINLDDSANNEERYKSVLNHLKYVFTNFKFEEEIEL
jgi:hypothetical protein